MARKRRTFTSELKAQAVLKVLTGIQSAAEVCRRHKIKPKHFAIWKALCSNAFPTSFSTTIRQATIHKVLPKR